MIGQEEQVPRDVQDLTQVGVYHATVADHHHALAMMIRQYPFHGLHHPTAELVSQHVYDEVKRRLLDFDAGRVRIRRVEVWENDSACAICEE